MVVSTVFDRRKEASWEILGDFTLALGISHGRAFNLPTRLLGSPLPIYAVSLAINPPLYFAPNSMHPADGQVAVMFP